MAATFQGKRVSTQWQVVLQAAWDDGVRFTLTSGKRTMADQWRLYRQKGGYNSVTNPDGAAFPNPNAPHIRVGRPNHAIDVNSLDGGENRLQRWLIKHGADARNTVSTEAWHLELSAADLYKLYKKFKKKPDPFRGYPEDERRWIREYDRLKKTKRDPKRREVLRRVMKQRRKEIWRVAQKAGWNKARRAKRYASLRARTR